jgi:LAO/AO transport system kinase
LIQGIISQIALQDKRALARAVSIVENESAGYEELLLSLQFKPVPVIGITGPPGAGKSTLISALAKHMVAQGKKIAIIAVDPSSPFNRGALMGDRVRMGEHFLHPDVYIRSMASRGNLGGLSPKILEVTDLLRSAWFDYIIIETVGVGQSEVEIAALADTTILALVPEAGDEIQTIKSGVMEIADIYVLNKADRDGAATFYKNLTMLAHSHQTAEWEAPVIKTIAVKNEGIAELYAAIEKHEKANHTTDRKAVLLAEKALTMIKALRTKDISFEKLLTELKAEAFNENFNLYQYVKKFKVQ